LFTLSGISPAHTPQIRAVAILVLSVVVY